MQRIDTFLVEHDLAESREQAKRLILAGAVTVNGNANIKPGQRIPAEAEVVVQERQKYVSRGGFKLEKALKHLQSGYAKSGRTRRRRIYRRIHRLSSTTRGKIRLCR